MNEPAHAGSSPVVISLEELLGAYVAIRPTACPSCGIEVRELRGEDCPACGQGLRLRVSLESPNSGAYLTGLCGLAAGLGFAVLAIGVTVWESIGHGMDWPELVAFSVMAVAFLPLLLLWIGFGGRIRRLSAVMRWGLAVLCAMLPFVAFLSVFLILFR